MVAWILKVKPALAADKGRDHSKQRARVRKTGDDLSHFWAPGTAQIVCSVVGMRWRKAVITQII